MQWYEITITIVTVLLGGGVLGVVVKAFVDNRIAKRNSENESERDHDNVWNQIVANLQNQITVQTENFTKQMEFVTGQLNELREKYDDLENRLTIKDKLLLKAIAHFGVLEALIPENVRPQRPEGFE
jgi:ribosomal protein L6P/L9E